jgi:hypothetical protein
VATSHPVIWADQLTGTAAIAAVQAQLTTPIIDGGTQAEKTAMRLELFSDIQNAGELEIAWSDNDYQSWSSYVKVTLNESRTFVDDLGTFRRRAFRFRHLGPTPMRLQRAVLTVLVGAS